MPQGIVVESHTVTSSLLEMQDECSGSCKIDWLIQPRWGGEAVVSGRAAVCKCGYPRWLTEVPDFDW